MFTKYVLDTFSLSNDPTPQVEAQRVRVPRRESVNFAAPLQFFAVRAGSARDFGSADTLGSPFIEKSLH